MRFEAKRRAEEERKKEELENLRGASEAHRDLELDDIDVSRKFTEYWDPEKKKISHIGLKK